MRDAGLIEFRRHYPDVVGQRTGDLLDDFQAGSMDAVVIGAENAHPFKCLLRSIPPAVRAPSYPSHAVEANPADGDIPPRFRGWSAWHERLSREYHPRPGSNVSM